jgi:hypothetical protein
MIVAKILQTRVVNFKDLCSKKLVNDIKEAAICEVRTVCGSVCHRCPYVLEYIDLDKIYLKGLSSYSIKLKKAESEQLLIFITAPNLDNWLKINNLPFIVPKIKEKVIRVKPIARYNSL